LRGIASLLSALAGTLAQSSMSMSLSSQSEQRRERLNPNRNFFFAESVPGGDAVPAFLAAGWKRLGVFWL